MLTYSVYITAYVYDQIWFVYFAICHLVAIIIDFQEKAPMCSGFGK